MDRLHIISDGNLVVGYDTSPTVRLGINCLLIQKNDKNILVDTGTGSFNPDETKYEIEYPRQILTELNTINLKPTDIDIVILTHFHFDHCGGCMSNRYDPVFDNATHYVQDREVQYSNNNPEFSKYALPFFNTLDKCDLLRVANGNISIEDTIELISSPGHTAGFQYVKFILNKQNYIFPGDIIPTLWHLNNNNIIDIDYDLEALNNSKKKIIENCINNDAIMIFQHSLRPTMGKLVNRGARIGFQKIPV